MDNLSRIIALWSFWCVCTTHMCLSKRVFVIIIIIIPTVYHLRSFFFCPAHGIAHFPSPDRWSFYQSNIHNYFPLKALTNFATEPFFFLSYTYYSNSLYFIDIPKLCLENGKKKNRLKEFIKSNKKNNQTCMLELSMRLSMKLKMLIENWIQIKRKKISWLESEITYLLRKWSKHTLK